MPKQRITQEMVLDAAFARLRKAGKESVTVKAIASDLGCSVQPIYTYCNSMDGLMELLNKRVNEFVSSFIREHVDMDDLFRSIGYAHTLLAKEEPHVFAAYILQSRNGIESMADLYSKYADARLAQSISTELDIPLDAARKLHLNMLIYTLGLGVIYSTVRPGLCADEVFSCLEEAHDAFSMAAKKDSSGISAAAQD